MLTVLYIRFGGGRMVRKYIKLYERAVLKSKNKGTIRMSKKLNELKGFSAEDILKKTGQEENVPVNLDKIIDDLKIYRKAMDFSEMEKIEGKGKISGLVLLLDNNVAVFYNKNDSLERKRFTAAHEIGHCCLHANVLKNDYIEFLHDDGFENEHETEASIFATKLLIPEKSLRYVYDSLLKPNLNDLSEMFQVPNKIMDIRLKELGLLV